MTLRARIALTLLVLTTILVAPAVYGLYTLWELREIAQNLRTRDAVGALALGRLQTALGEVEHWQRIHVVLAGPAPEDSEVAQQRAEQHMARVEAELDHLAAAGYAVETRPARQRWEELVAAIREEQRLLEAGAFDAVEAHREEVVNPLHTAMDGAVDPIGLAINRAGEAQVQRAQELAAAASTTTLLALAVALLLGVIIAGWLTASLLRPIHELRRGMAVVAEGEFGPEVRIPPDRPDELGDLARSFGRMTHQLEELDRLKAEFVSIASHELKTPLSVIKGYISLLQEGIYGPVSEQQRQVHASISDQTDRLGRLIQQLLDISRFEAGGGRLEIQPIHFHDFLADLARSFEPLAVQNQIDFELCLDGTTPEAIAGDADRLNEVVGNLLSNAFKFTPRGGQIRLSAAAADGGALVEVADTGVGIPSADLPKIFEKFYQVENRAQPRSVGSGLGLAIAREIVQAHGGTIAAESEVGRGTTFRVFLPGQPVPEGSDSA